MMRQRWNKWLDYTMPRLSLSRVAKAIAAAAIFVVVIYYIFYEESPGKSNLIFPFEP